MESKERAGFLVDISVGLFLVSVPLYLLMVRSKGLKSGHWDGYLGNLAKHLM
jgi:hypothetical protein